MPTAKGDPQAWAALARAKGLTPAAGGPWLTLAVVVPVATRGTLNSREHWAARARRVKREREVVRNFLWSAAESAPWGLRGRKTRVTLTRVNGGKMDDDNLPGALKGVRDEVASGWFGWDDADPRFDWRYAQEPGRGPAQVRITFEVGAV